MQIKKLISAFIFIVPAFCWAIDRTTLEVEYSKINELKKPKNVLEIRKFFIKPACTGSNDKKNVPEWLKELVNLEELDLGTTAEVADRQDCNIVVALPDDLRSLKKLKKFVVGDSFGKKSGDNISNIKMPTSLEILSLNRIELKMIPKWVFTQTNLKNLTIQYGSIYQIPAEIKNLRSLETLDFLSNQVNVLPNEINTLNSLKTLNLANNNVTKKQQAKILSLLPKVKINFVNEWDDSRANEE
ncbi:MAG: leucine-rich repeat domain-containing protein [Bdellovibrionaceae bacterium]|nr:leucine-rich repeat domain-containing protein [Pseudobdellovibrionaceae bacterium]